MVSVIIPVFNGREFIDKIMKCLKNQTYNNLEIIIVDDGSTDKSLDIIRKYAADDNRIKVLSQANMGPGAARNAGLKIAAGEYVAFVDADDYIPDDYIQVLVSEIKDNDCCVCGLTITNNAEKTITVSAQGKVYPTTLFIEEALKGGISPVIAYSGPVNRLWRRQVIEGNHIEFNTDYRYGEDTVFNLDVLTHCKKVAVTDKTAYIAVEYSGSLSRSYSVDRFNAYKDIRSRLYTIAADADETIKVNIAQYLTDNFLARAGEILALTISKKEKTVLLKALAGCGMVNGKEIKTARGKANRWKMLAAAINMKSGMLVYLWFVLLPRLKT